MKTQITIAHLTDVHLGPIAGFSPRYWNVKRLLGYANWLRNRRDAYQREVLDRIVADLMTQAPDHIAVTGDLVNIGLPQEHINALAWVESLGAAHAVSVIPGNHDIYSRLGGDPGTARWSAYMASCAQGAEHAGGGEFPFVRMLGGVAIIGINSAVPTLPLVASGRVGAEQLARLDRVLERLGRAGHFRLVLIHHPPLPGQAKRLRGLRDAVELERILDAARSRTRRARPQPPQHAGLVRHGADGDAGCRGTVGVSLAPPQGRAARPLQSLPHRGAALVHRADRPRAGNGERRDRGAGAASIAAGGPGMTKGHESREKYSRSRTPHL